MPISLDLTINTEDEAMRLLAHHLRIARALFEATDRPAHAILTRLQIHLNGDDAAIAGARGFLFTSEKWYGGDIDA